MKSKYKYFYDNPWTVLKFPKRNKAILYNGKTKQYGFYDLQPVPIDEKSAKKLKPVDNQYPVKLLMFLAGALGVSFALNVIKMFM